MNIFDTSDEELLGESLRMNFLKKQRPHKHDATYFSSTGTGGTDFRLDFGRGKNPTFTLDLSYACGLPKPTKDVTEATNELERWRELYRDLDFDCCVEIAYDHVAKIQKKIDLPINDVTSKGINYKNLRLYIDYENGSELEFGIGPKYRFSKYTKDYFKEESDRVYNCSEVFLDYGIELLFCDYRNCDDEHKAKVRHHFGCLYTDPPIKKESMLDSILESSTKWKKYSPKEAAEATYSISMHLHDASAYDNNYINKLLVSDDAGKELIRFERP